MNGPSDPEHRTHLAPPTAAVSSTESATLSTPARRAAAVSQLSRRTPTFKPPLRRLSSGSSLSKVNAAFKSPIRTDTSQPNTNTDSCPESTDRQKSDACTPCTLKARKPSSHHTASRRASPYCNTRTRPHAMQSSKGVLSSQRETVEDMARDMAQLKQQLEDAESEVAELSKEYSEDELQQYIDHLHQYNEIKDAGQLLLGKLAEVQGTTISELYGQFDLNLDD